MSSLKYSILLALGFLFFQRAEAQEDRGYKIYQFPANMIPRIDGSMDDWADFPEEYVVGTDHLWDDSKHYPEVECIVVRKSPDKAQYAHPKAILIDDRMKSIEPWRAAGGIGILHTSAEDTIAQLQSIIGVD